MPEGNNVDSTILKLAEEYQGTVIKSRELNERRAELRSNIEKLGVDPTAFQAGLRMARDMTKGERSDYTGSLDRVLGVLDGREADLFGADEVAKRDKRAEKRAAKEAAPASTDDNPRSDPKKGGAGGASGKGKAKDGSGGKAASGKGRGKPGNVVPIKPATLKDAVKQSDAAIDDSLAEFLAREQEEGGAVLDGHIEAMKDGAAPVENSGENGGEGGAPLSQSAQSARALEKAGLLS